MEAWEDLVRSEPVLPTIRGGAAPGGREDTGRGRRSGSVAVLRRRKESASSSPLSRGEPRPAGRFSSSPVASGVRTFHPVHIGVIALESRRREFQRTNQMKSRSKMMNKMMAPMIIPIRAPLDKAVEFEEGFDVAEVEGDVEVEVDVD